MTDMCPVVPAVLKDCLLICKQPQLEMGYRDFLEDGCGITSNSMVCNLMEFQLNSWSLT